jgi:hypothetical protein
VLSEREVESNHVSKQVICEGEGKGAEGKIEIKDHCLEKFNDTTSIFFTELCYVREKRAELVQTTNKRGNNNTKYLAWWILLSLSHSLSSVKMLKLRKNFFSHF